jgi:hypothetical protein
MSLIAMSVGELMAVAPVFDPLGKTLHYLADFHHRATTVDAGARYFFFAEPLALITCPIGLLLFAVWLAFYSKRHASRVTRMRATLHLIQSINPSST